MSILVTGAAGFIGFHLSETLLKQGHKIIGIDNLNPYYSVALKEARLDQLSPHKNFTFIKMDFSDQQAVFDLIQQHPDIEGIIHLGAQAGVRYSLEAPHDYVRANITGHLCLLEAARKLKNIKHFVYASTSSVYGANTKMPFSPDDKTDAPLAPYAVSKKTNELMSHAYAYLYKMPQTGLRFFTVYGPWGRPDMAAYLFAKAIENDKPITVYNNGDMYRDFTYIDDIVAGIIGAYECPFDPALPIPARVYNLGNNNTEKLTDYIAEIEKALGKKATMNMAPLQPGDVLETYADITASRRDFGFQPKVRINEGIPRFIEWYKSYHKSGSNIRAS